MTRETILGLMNPLIALVFATTFLVIWSRARERQYILAIAFAYLMLGTGFFVSHLAESTVSFLHKFGTNFFYTVGTIPLVWAVCTRAGKRAYLPFLVSLGAVMLAIITWLYLHRAWTYNQNLYVSNTTYGVMFAIAVFQVRHAWRKDAIEKLLLAMLALTVLQFFIRPVVTLTAEGAIDGASYRDSVYYSILNLTVALVSVMMAMSLIAACVSDIVRDIRAEALRDKLTGLRSRADFEETAERAFCDRRRSAMTASLVVADIDHFKSVNDNHGHQAGDNAIAAFGELLGSTVRVSDIAGRIGGEEFCVLLWGANAASARLFAENLRAAWSATVVDGIPAKTRLTASFGVTEVHSGDTYETAFARADKALYEAKNAGRDRVAVADTANDNQTISGVVTVA